MSDKLQNVPSIEDDPNIIRQGKNVTIQAPTATITAKFGPAPNKES